MSALTKLSAAIMAGMFGTVSLAQNIPTGPTVISGSATFSTVGNNLTVTNSPNAIINWQSFSIGAGATVRFTQTSASSSVLNRVIDPNASVINGVLSSNGRVTISSNGNVTLASGNVGLPGGSLTIISTGNGTTNTSGTITAGGGTVTITSGNIGLPGGSVTVASTGTGTTNTSSTITARSGTVTLASGNAGLPGGSVALSASITGLSNTAGTNATRGAAVALVSRDVGLPGGSVTSNSSVSGSPLGAPTGVALTLAKREVSF